jgi:hypothetical protein
LFGGDMMIKGTNQSKSIALTIAARKKEMQV